MSKEIYSIHRTISNKNTYYHNSPFPVKPYRTPPASNIQSSATQKCCRMAFFFFFCIIFFTIRFFSIEKFVILRVKHFIYYYCIYRIVIPQNLNLLLRLVVAKWTFAVWFYALKKWWPGEDEEIGKMSNQKTETWEDIGVKREEMDKRIKG